MDPRERTNDHLEAFESALDGRQSELWTAMPVIVQAFNAAEMTVTLQVAIQIGVRNQVGILGQQNIPPLIHCPVQFPSGGGFTLTFPIAPGDEGLAVFASRCIDSWWQAGGYQNPQVEFRLHDLSDGFYVPGFRSVPRVLSGISNNSLQLRSDDGTTYVEVKNGQLVNIVAPGGCVITTPILRVNGTVEVTDDVEVAFGGASFVSLQNHVHSGVQTGPSDTGPAVPGT